MDWYLWAIVVYWVLNALVYIGMVGKKLEFTAGTAVLAVIFYTAAITGLVVTR